MIFNIYNFNKSICTTVIIEKIKEDIIEISNNISIIEKSKNEKKSKDKKNNKDNKNNKDDKNNRDKKDDNNSKIEKTKKR